MKEWVMCKRMRPDGVMEPVRPKQFVQTYRYYTARLLLCESFESFLYFLANVLDKLPLAFFMIGSIANLLP